MPAELDERLSHYCADNGITYSEAIRRLLAAGLARAEGDEAQAKATRRARR